ncbi:MAG: hypothetical protein AAF998_10470 [Bacteroidota bacterium]
MKTKHIALMLLAVLVILSGCGSSDQAAGQTAAGDYLASFTDYKKSTVEFSAENLPGPIQSPYDDKVVYPLGKIQLEDDQTLALVTIYDGSEPLGEVYAELLSGTERKATLKIAESDLGFHQHANLEIPFIEVIEEPADAPISKTTYKITGQKFQTVTR